MPGVIVTAESTAASVENARLVGNGLSDMGMVLGSVAYNAHHGLPPFEQPLDIVALFQMYPAPQHLVVLKESGIKSVNDLPASGCPPRPRAATQKPSRWPFSKRSALIPTAT